MHKFYIGVAMATLLCACSPKDKTVDIPPAETEIVKEEPVPPKAPYDLKAQYKKFAPVRMTPDTSFLRPSERRTVNKLMEASRHLNAIYLRQLDIDNPKTRRDIKESETENNKDLRRMFNLHYGRCDTLEDGYVFYGDEPCPDGGGFYPEDMTKAEFEQWITDHPDQEAAFRSPYTVIRRSKDGGLRAVPYSLAYTRSLEAIAVILREAADISRNRSLKNFLRLRADSLLSDDYFDSEMAWMDLNGNIEVAIGPYEVYDDKLFGYKTAFEMFLTIKDPQKSADLAKYKNYLKDMEANLPVEDRYKNFKRGFESPIVVADQVKGGGDNVPGVQTIAFNLPNDERVREAKGAKKVILDNVLGAKYDRILAPIGERVLVPEQAELTAKVHMSNSTLFHELSHSLGPGSISVDGRETTVSAELKDLYSGIEEGKADVMGAYNVLYMMTRGELPAAEKNAFLATYFTGLFRSMRFGIDAAHGKGAAFQYSYFRETGAAEWLEAEGRYRLDFAALESAITDLTGIVIRVQGDGDYEAAKAFLDQYVKQDGAAKTVLGKLSDIPYDIRPIYPKEL